MVCLFPRKEDICAYSIKLMIYQDFVVSFWPKMIPFPIITSLPIGFPNPNQDH
jgi:hypothetical protein